MYIAVPKNFKCSACGHETYTTHESCLKCRKEGTQEKILKKDTKRLIRIIEIYNETGLLHDKEDTEWLFDLAKKAVN